MTAAAEHRFKVNDKAENLGQGSGDLFHSTKANILFVGRSDVQTPVAFLCTRVKSLDNGMLLARNEGTMVDAGGASFAAHQDMRSHPSSAEVQTISSNNSCFIMVGRVELNSTISCICIQSRNTIYYSSVQA